MNVSEKKQGPICIKTAMKAGYVPDYHDCLSDAARLCGGGGNIGCYREAVNDCKEKFGIPFSPVSDQAL